MEFKIYDGCSDVEIEFSIERPINDVNWLSLKIKRREEEDYLSVDIEKNNIPKIIDVLKLYYEWLD